ncbi:MAG TPA: SDR family oxidoreductase [Anaerolineales bacterium]|nr:SDR family oxidoreductase [Anaerolineales bacterium]
MNDNPFINQGVVVTGASTGIGEAVALHLDTLGFRVFAGVRKTSDGVNLARRASKRFIPIILDVTDQDGIDASAAQVGQAMGDKGLVGLVNNAGIAVASPLEFIPIPDMRRQLEVNVIGQLAVTQAYMPLLRQGQGRIVFVSSISGRVAAPFLGPYAISKFALEALSDALRRELLLWGMHVAVIQPGRIVTPIWEKSLAAADELAARLSPGAQLYYGEAMEINRERIARRRGGTPVERVAEATAHALTSARPKTRYLVGWDARFGALLGWLLSDRWLDSLIARQRGIIRK